MLSILQRKYNQIHKLGGKPPKLTTEDKLYITLKYLREYRTMDSIAAKYGVCKGTVCLTIQWEKSTQEKVSINRVYSIGNNLKFKKILKRHRKINHVKLAENGT
ncbi:MAG: transposase family protein [Treponema sp.]|nr:transposase family protein [Treponema sp.]